MNKEFLHILKKTQPELKKYVVKELKRHYKDIIIEDGFVFAQGTFPVLLVAHLDTVHETKPKMIMVAGDKDIISSPEGIGGDDRCGVYMIFEVIKKYNCSVLFCEDEEIGGIGAHKFTKSKVAQSLDFNYIIEFDRKGKNDAVFYDCDNVEFEQFITEKFYKAEYGTFSDISIIAPYLGVAAVNLSCGYYNAHTKSEYIVISEMQASINATCDILASTTDENKYIYVESTSMRDSYFGNIWGEYDYDEQYFLFEYADDNGIEHWEEIYATNQDEAVGIFCRNNPRIPYVNIISIYDESVLG